MDERINKRENNIFLNNLILFAFLMYIQNIYIFIQTEESRILVIHLPKFTSKENNNNNKNNNFMFYDAQIFQIPYL